jgi:hypothetical protein
MPNRLEFTDLKYEYNKPFYGKNRSKVYIDNVFHGFVVVEYIDNPDHTAYIEDVYQAMSKEERYNVKHFDVPPRKMFSHYLVYSSYCLLCVNDLPAKCSNDFELIEYMLKENGNG